MKTRIIFTLIVMLIGSSLYADTAQGPINAAYRASADAFIAGADWMPYPKYSDREGWNMLLTEEEREYFIKKGEKHLKYATKS